MGKFEQVARQLDRYELDGMLILSEPNRRYVSAFHSTAGVILVTRQGSWFFTDSRYIEAAARQITDAQVEENTRERPALARIKEISAGLSLKRLGYEETYLTVAELHRLEERLDGELIPAAALLEEMRAVKDAWELEQMVRAQRIAEKALKETLNYIRPGRTEREIAAFLQYQMLLGGGEKMSFDPIVVSGPNSSMPHGVPTDKPVVAGDFITMDFGCVYNGYCSDMTRTVAVDHVTDEMERVYSTVLAAQSAGISAARPGVTGAEIHEAADRVICAAGYGGYFGHGFGHSLGIEIHESPNASPGWVKPLPEGAVLSAEPGIYLPGKFGVRIEDVIILKGEGSEDITLAPKSLMIL